MEADTETRSVEDPEPSPEDGPRVSVCESAPGTAVFIESGNTDGWIASDHTVDLSR
jgi:hypothetical protein